MTFITSYPSNVDSGPGLIGNRELKTDYNAITAPKIFIQITIELARRWSLELTEKRHSLSARRISRMRRLTL